MEIKSHIPFEKLKLMKQRTKLKDKDKWCDFYKTISIVRRLLRLRQSALGPKRKGPF